MKIQISVYVTTLGPGRCGFPNSWSCSLKWPPCGVLPSDHPNLHPITSLFVSVGGVKEWTSKSLPPAPHGSKGGLGGPRVTKLNLHYLDLIHTQSRGAWHSEHFSANHTLWTHLAFALLWQNPHRRQTLPGLGSDDASDLSIPGNYVGRWDGWVGQQIPSLSGCVQPHANLHVVRHRMECGVLEEPSPTSSTLSGQYSNELDYIPNCFDSKQWVETPLHLGFLPVRFTRSPTFNADIVSERIASDVRSLESPLFAQRNLVGDRRRASWRTLRYDLQQSSILTQNYIFRLQPTSAAIFPSAISPRRSHHPSHNNCLFRVLSPPQDSHALDIYHLWPSSLAFKSYPTRLLKALHFLRKSLSRLVRLALFIECRMFVLKLFEPGSLRTPMRFV